MRLVFLGTPADAVIPLRTLVRAGHEVALVVTQPDRRRSRGRGADPTPVKVAASELGLPVLTPSRARDVIEDVRSSGAQLGVVVAFGQLLPPAFLDAVPHGFVNVHFSLLPRWRGAAPVERAILAGDREAGVSLMRIEEGLDTGGVYASATYAEKLSVDEFRIDPRRSADELSRLVRAGNPRPGAWLVVGGKRVKVWRAHAASGDGTAGTIQAPAALVTEDGALRLEEVQPEGRPRMSAEAWLAGVREPTPTVDRGAQ